MSLFVEMSIPHLIYDIKMMYVEIYLQIKIPFLIYDQKILPVFGQRKMRQIQILFS